MYEVGGTVRGMASDMDGVETKSQSSESVGEGEDPEVSSIGS